MPDTRAQTGETKVRFAKVTLYVAFNDYCTSVETTGQLPDNALDYVMPALEQGLDNDPDVTVLDFESEEMRLVTVEQAGSQ